MFASTGIDPAAIAKAAAKEANPTSWVRVTIVVTLGIATIVALVVFKAPVTEWLAQLLN
jgi:hypothetical protein